MNKTPSLQLIVLIGAVVIFGVLYFGFDTKAPGQEKVDKSRALASTTTDFQTILEAAKNSAGGMNLANIVALEARFEKTTEDSSQTEILKQLSGEWFKLGFPEIAGHYAAAVAELERTPEAWAIAGTTFNYGIQADKNDRLRAFCFEQAVAAFENAVSLDPQNIDFQINLALTYVANPPQDNPMKGILMLRNLQEKNPNNPRVLFQLGRLALSTGQIDKAIQRLEQAQNLEPDNLQTVCLLAETYAKAGLNAEAEKYAARCEQLKR